MLACCWCCCCYFCCCLICGPTDMQTFNSSLHAASLSNNLLCIYLYVVMVNIGFVDTYANIEFESITPWYNFKFSCVIITNIPLCCFIRFLAPNICQHSIRVLPPPFVENRRRVCVFISCIICCVVGIGCVDYTCGNIVYKFV